MTTNAGVPRNIPNPYPRILTKEILDIAEQGWIDNGGQRFSLTNKFPPVGTPEEFDLANHTPRPRAITSEMDNLLRDAVFSDKVEELKDAFSKTNEWQVFKAEVLPIFRRYDNANISNAVCLGLGSFVECKNLQQLTKRIQELAIFLVLCEYINTRHDKSPKLPIILHDPLFDIHDAHLLSLVGIRTIRAPHFEKYIGTNTFLFALHLPHEQTWNSALQNANPIIYIGVDLEFSRRRCMADAFLEARHSRHPDRPMQEVHDVFEQSQTFVNDYNHQPIKDVVPAGQSLGNSVFGNDTTIWFRN